MNQQTPNRQSALDSIMAEHFSAELSVNDSQMPESRKVQRGDTTYTQNTANSDQLFRRAQKYAQHAEHASEGARNIAAFRLAGHLHAFVDERTGETLTEDQIGSIVLDWNAGNTPPLPEQEIHSAVRSGMTNGTPREPKVGCVQTRSRYGADAPAEPPKSYQGPHGIELKPTDARSVGARGKAEVTFGVSINGKTQAP